MDEIQNLRSIMHRAAEKRAAEKQPLPDRFEVVSGQGPQAILTDTKTGRTTVVPLFVLGAVRNVLNDLFPDQ